MNRASLTKWVFVTTPMLAALACDATGKAPPYSAVADVKQVMAAIVEPGADTYWDAVGSVDDSTGTTYHYPQSSEEWTAVRNGAIAVTEGGNLLLMPPRARDTAEWRTLTLAMMEVGRRAIASAEARDTAAVFRVGAELYDSCTNCHSRYVVGQAQPPLR